MSTKPKHGYAEIALDARNVILAAQADLSDPAFAKYVDAHELAVLKANAEKLAAGVEGNTDKLHAQVGAGAHAAHVRAALFAIVSHIRDEAALLWGDPSSSFHDDAKARAFGYGRSWNVDSTASVESFAHLLLTSAAAEPSDAANIGLDANGLNHLHDALSALEGAQDAHLLSKQERQVATLALDALAHTVSAEVAHLRYIASRVFKNDAARLLRYASALPRHEVKHRAPKATPGEEA